MATTGVPVIFVSLRHTGIGFEIGFVLFTVTFYEPHTFIESASVGSVEMTPAATAFW